MRQFVINVICFLALPVLGVMYTRDRQAVVEAQQSALAENEARLAEADRARAEQARLAAFNAQVGQLVAESDTLKAAKRDHRVKFPDLVEPDLPGHVSFAQLEAARRAKRQPPQTVELSEELRRLDGQTVTITGFTIVAWPVEPILDVVLAKNPWDECCLGTPPTVFDSVLVKMAAETPLSKGRIRVASLTGTFRIRPNFDESGQLDQLFVLEAARESEAAVPASEAQATAEATLAGREVLYVWAMPILLVLAVANNLIPSGAARPASPAADPTAGSGARAPSASPSSGKPRYSIED